MNLSGFERWRPLDSVAVKDVPEQGKFVYIFRKHSTKELLYVGGTTNLRQRLFRNYIGGVGGGTTQRIHAVLFKEGAIKDTEVAWLETPYYYTEEERLKDIYKKEYGKLPPWNKR